MTFFVYNRVRMSRVALMNMRWELPYWGEGIYVYPLLLRVVVVLRSSRLEGILHPPPLEWTPSSVLLVCHPWPYWPFSLMFTLW